MPSTTGLGLAPSVIPGPNTTTRPCDRSVTATAAPYAASLIASSPCSLPCSGTKPSTTLHGLTPPTPSPHDHKHSLYKRWGVRSKRGTRLAARERARSARDVLAVGGGIEPPTIQTAEIRKPASARHSLALTGSLRAPVCATGSVMSCGIISSRRMALGGGIEPPTMQSHEITKPASVRHSLAVLGSRQCPSVAKVWQTG